MLPGTLKESLKHKFVTAIVAVNQLGYIDDGKGGLPWGEPIKEDMKWFRHHTLGTSLIMGRKTFESLPAPLKDRNHFIISRQKGDIFDHGDSCYSLSLPMLGYLLKRDRNNAVTIIGGGETYRLFEDAVDRVYLTEVTDNVTEGTIKFDYDLTNKDKWKVTHCKQKGQLIFSVYDKLKTI